MSGVKIINCANYRTKVCASNMIKSKAGGMRGKMPKLTSSMILEEEKMFISKVRGDGNERVCHHEENAKLRKSVLNKLWDSLPPETQISRYSEDEDSDSDATRSGLDQEDDGEDKENSQQIANILSNRKDDHFTNCAELKNRQSQEARGLESISKSHSCTCAVRENNDPTTSWGINFDFIQAIIWLKSTTTKLQRVPADEFLKAFETQWDLSPKTKLSKLEKNNGGSETSLRHFKNPNNDLSRSVSITKTEQRERTDLITNRFAAYNICAVNQPDVTIIPESDESEPPSLQSSQSVPMESAAIEVRVSESMATINSTVDSGFNSEKPESGEMITNFEPQKAEPISSLKLLGGKSHGTLTRSEESSSRKNSPVVGRYQIGKRIMKRKGAGDDSKSGKSKKKRLSISSARLNCVLRSSECNRLLHVSVKAILKFLENEKDASSLRVKWHGSVQKEAIEAIVNVIKQLDKEKGPNLCRKEVVAMIKRVLEKMLHANEVDKLTIWEHHRLLVLELCNALSVCTEVANYLISELKRLIPVVVQTTEENMRLSAVVMDKSYVLFHSLKIVVVKYKLLVPSTATTSCAEKNESEKIPEVTKLWKRHWNVKENEPDIFVTNLERLDSHEDHEEVWTKVLEELAIASTTFWPMVKVLAWDCLAVLR